MGGYRASAIDYERVRELALCDGGVGNLAGCLECHARVGLESIRLEFPLAAQRTR